MVPTSGFALECCATYIGLRVLMGVVAPCCHDGETTAPFAMEVLHCPALSCCNAEGA